MVVVVMYDAREEKTSGEPLRRKKQSAACSGEEKPLTQGSRSATSNTFGGKYYILVES